MDVVTSVSMRALCSPCLLALLSLAAVVTTTYSEDVSLPHRRARGLIQAPATKEQPFASILYTAVIRGKVALPCDITPPSADDTVALVLWYKDEGPAPIYTLDARRGHVDQARQSAVSELGARAYFNMMNRPAFLQLDPVEEEDAGEYRCRVDFRKARSVNTVINLKVIVPPGDPVILDEDGKQLQGLVGPYNEGDPLTLTCQVEVGKPRPAVTWWKDYAQLDESYFFSPDGSLVKNKLEVAAITRNDLLATFTCQAANNNITIPASVSITLDLNLKPLDVTIQPPERPLSANKEVELVCSSSGSRPPATLTWWKGGQQIRSARDSEDAAGSAGGGGGLSASTSVLLFTPTVDDNNRILSCRAENKAIPGSALEEGWKLEVYYTPMVTLQLGGKLKDSEIQEGRDVYLDCKIVANPYTTDVSWLFEGRELPANASAGVIVSTQSLVLQRVQRAQRGRYACAATNKEGRGVSNDLYLRVKYAPVCKTHQKWVYGASQQETVSVRCELDADPAETTFRWVFNSSASGRRRDLAPQDASSSGSRSTLAFSVRSDDDYGTLLCWGTNSVGIQRDPCAFSIVPAGPPDSVINCSQVNATEDGMSLECIEGPWDGGMAPPVFIAELYDADSGTLRANLTNTLGAGAAFVARGLPGGATFRVLVYAANGKGRSNPYALMAHTLRPAEKFTGVQGMIVIRPFLGVLIGIVIALVIAAVVVIIFIRCKKHGRSKGAEKDQMEDKSMTLLKKDPDESVDLEEKGPDIIPATTVFSGYDAAHEKMVALAAGMDSYTAQLPLKESLESLGNHRTASPKKDVCGSGGGEVTYAELSFPKAVAVLPVQQGGTLRRAAAAAAAAAASSGTHNGGAMPQLPEPPTEYARIDFHRTLRPVPGNLGLTGEELEDEGGSSCETPLMANRRESTV
ncbi:protein turtle homolog B-like isoform X2 [Dermacentor variabilis]|uniref:protein turtle homolog B-like isoform X2 n=1 Tax=Dermacentor variabilis TaxID=34621 RepID=UPI003F5C1965